ncbi:outer dense fiber protein 3-like [Tribolium madens]|uniref:outer dense fiber protein 3-like n=1 Tax=Tribolium madens TaxID=41895 RepID=UPI001CF75593|nr:outer dense fiber protein 3-like [Tribolium madens]
MVRTQIGPGPGKYLLPPLVGYKDHDPSKYRNPQYSMGSKLPLSRKDLGPGPKYNTEYMTNYGKAHPPAYSLASRPNPLGAFQGPGPAAYDLQNAPRMKEPRPPAYSMSSRHQAGKGFVTPGPNNYDIPTTLGPKVPDKHANGAFSMSDRYKQSSKEQSPGPAKYDPTSPNSYKNKPPAYSMSIKHKALQDRGTYPGPSNYYPKLPGKGGFSFGLKTDNPPYITPDDDMPCVNK